jgi:dTDP-4-amino-4,6-dideoxygalactose transaminase
VDVRFCDIDPESMNVDPDAFAALVTPRTRALLMVHYGGFPADMARIMAIAREHDILVVEDCAHALGSSYHGRRPGSLADIGCFSFHSSKNITTLGEGGMLTFDRDDWAERVARIRSNDADGVYEQASGLIRGTELPPTWAVHSGEAYTRLCREVRWAGSNATLSEAGAAVGLVQMERLGELVTRRRSIAARLEERLRGVPGLRVPQVPPGLTHAYHLYSFFLEPGFGMTRDAFLARMEELGVQMQLRYLPLYLQPEWRHRGHGPGECPTAERLWFDEQVNLPCHPSLSDDQVEHMLAALDTVLAEAAHRPTAPVGAGTGPTGGTSWL